MTFKTEHDSLHTHTYTRMSNVHASWTFILYHKLVYPFQSMNTNNRTIYLCHQINFIAKKRKKEKKISKLISSCPFAANDFGEWLSSISMPLPTFNITPPLLRWLFQLAILLIRIIYISIRQWVNKLITCNGAIKIDGC